MSARETAQVLGKYAIVRELGRGGFATVYLAQDTVLRRSVALKILHPVLLTDPSFVQRFEQEARACAQLSHPNVVAVHDVGEETVRLFFVMELIDGESLAALLAGGGADRRRLVRLLERIARGIDHAHEHGIVHRDLKPANILVTRQGEPKIADFEVLFRKQQEAGAIPSDDELKRRLRDLADASVASRS